MKPRDVQRSVKSMRIERSAGDAPSIGRVSRVPGTGRAKGSRRRKRKSENSRGNRHRKNRHRVVMAWSILFVVIALGVMAVAVWFWTADNMNRGSVVEDRGAWEGKERVKSRFPSPPMDQALSLVKRALRVQSVDEIPRYFRPGGAKPEEILAFLKNRPQTDGAGDQFFWISSVDANGLLIDGVLVQSSHGERTTKRYALLTPDEAGTWRIDFDAFARPMPHPWQDVVEGRAKESVVRVLVKSDHYFNGRFSKESEWNCYRLTSLGEDIPVYGYCPPGSQQAKALEEALSSSDLAVPDEGRRMTLKIARPEGAEAAQFEIQRVLAEDWIVSEKAFDESFH